MKPDYKICDSHNAGAISIIQFSTIPADTFQYIHGPRALKEGILVITEQSESGDVNNLIAKNNSPHYIFFSDGDILEGAKQNRVLNTAVLLKPESTFTLPVSCVEQGRWHYRSKRFSGSDMFAPHKLRKNKLDKMSERHNEREMHSRQTQSDVWRDVNEYSISYSISSETSDLTDVMKKKLSAMEQESRYSAPEKHPESNGIAVCVDGMVQMVEVFNRREILSEYFNRIVQSVVFDFEVPGIQKRDIKADEYHLLEHLDKLFSMEWKQYPATAEGNEYRISEGNLSGIQLCFGDHLIHMVAMR